MGLIRSERKIKVGRGPRPFWATPPALFFLSPSSYTPPWVASQRAQTCSFCRLLSSSATRPSFSPPSCSRSDLWLPVACDIHPAQHFSHFPGPGRSQAHHTYQTSDTTIHTRASTRTLQTILTLHPSFYGALVCTAPSVLLPTQDCDGARPVPRTRVNLVVGLQKQWFFFTFRWTALQDRSRLAVRDLWPRVLLSLRQGTSPPRASDTLDYNGIWCTPYACNTSTPLKIFPFNPCHYSQYPPTGIFASTYLQLFLAIFFLVCLQPIRSALARRGLHWACLATLVAPYLLLFGPSRIATA